MRIALFTEVFPPKIDGITNRLTGGRPDRPVVLYAGRISPERQLGRMVEVHDALPEVQVAFVGDGPARAELEERLGGERASFLGFLRGEELAEAFASADVFLMPSTTETLGFVVLEAMASGLPVVAARAGGIPDLVDSGVDGLLYEPGAPEERVKAVHEVLAGRAFRERLARAARASGPRRATGATRRGVSSTPTATRRCWRRRAARSGGWSRRASALSSLSRR
jgi:sulfoquinovosyltransferase